MEKGNKIKYLLIMLCLFLFSCDNNSNSHPLIGDWKVIDNSITYSDGCNPSQDSDDDYVYNNYLRVTQDGNWKLNELENNYTIISGTWEEIDSGINGCFDDPECENFTSTEEEDCVGAHYTCNWSDIENACIWENQDEPCFNMNIEFGENNQTFTEVLVEEEESCTKTFTRIYERMQ